MEQEEEVSQDDELTQTSSRELDVESRFKEGNWGYVFGTIGDQPGILGSHNENKLFYGASSPKPILALANLIKCNTSPEEGRCLSIDELRALLNYAPAERDKRGKAKKYWHLHDSNKVNRALSHVTPRSADYKDGTAKHIKKVGEELANFKDDKEASDFLEQLGLPRSMKIRYGTKHNDQTPLGYYNFIKLILNPSEDLMPGMSSAAQEILNYMRRDHGIDKSDREFNKRFEATRKYLNDKGIPVQNIYGKGGFARIKGLGAKHQASNSAMIIDNQYILVIFTGSFKHKNRPRGFRFLNDTIAQILIKSGEYHKY